MQMLIGHFARSWDGCVADVTLAGFALKWLAMGCGTQVPN